MSRSAELVNNKIDLVSEETATLDQPFREPELPASDNPADIGSSDRA
jgi:hypothetical protein